MSVNFNNSMAPTHHAAWMVLLLVMLKSIPENDSSVSFGWITKVLIAYGSATKVLSKIARFNDKIDNTRSVRSWSKAEQTMSTQEQLEYLRIYLSNVKWKGEFSRKDFSKAHRVQEHSDGDGSCIHEMQSLNEAKVLRRHESEEDQKVDLKSQKVFCPKVEDFEHGCCDFIKASVFFRAGRSVSSILNPGRWEPRPDQNIWKKDKDMFNKATTKVGL